MLGSVLRVNPDRECLVGRLWEQAGLVKLSKDRISAIDQVDNLLIVFVFHLSEPEPLELVRLLLLLKNLPDKVLLELFVCKVEAKLLKRVCVEDFEPSDVEDSDEGVATLPRYR